MHFILNGGGDEIGTITSEKYIHFLEDFGVRKILIIPLAIKEIKDINVFERNKNYLNKRFEKHLQFQVEILEFVDNEEVTDKKLKNTDSIYFTGGKPHVLINRLKKRNLINKIKDLNLKVISGGSAGEMVMGEKTIVGHIEVKKVIDGLNFIPGIIFDSHFSNRNRLDRLKTTIEKYNLNGIGIDENTVCVINDQFEIIDTFGSGSITYIKDNNIKIYGKN